MNEHDLINAYFVPLSKSFSGGLGLQDDAAILDIPAGQDLVVTKDAISAGVHFIGDEDPALIARKLLRTNLSDLAAMGAAPLCYFLAIALPKPISEHYIARFAQGIAEDQREFNIHLAGGDTIATLGAPIFSLTAHGLVPKGQALRRNGAKAGDVIYVSGTLGDAALGLRQCQVSGVRGQEDDFLTKRYLLPEPRLALGISLRGQATSCMDISDGLMQDIGHICRASDVGAEIYQELLPLSDAAKNMLAQSPEYRPLIYSGGDDYELLFTLPENAAPPAGVTRIGRITEGKTIQLLHHGAIQTIASMGYSH